MTGAKKDWYSPGSIMPGDKKVCIRPDQLEWIIEHYEILNDGRWPPKSSGYIDNPFAPPSPQSSSGAYFETPMAVMSEFNFRLHLCGRDGTIFLCCRCLGWERALLAESMGIRRSRIDYVITRVRDYIIGRRKDRTYDEFKKHYSSGYRGTFRHKQPPLCKN